MTVSQLDLKQEQAKAAHRLHKAAFNLMVRKPFYGMMMQKVNRIADFSVSTIGVSMQRQSTQVCLVYNPLFVNHECKYMEQIFEHEMLHLVFDHISRFGKEKQADSIRANLACDMAINQLLDIFVPHAIYPPPEWEHYWPAEYYYRKLPSTEEAVSAVENCSCDQPGRRPGDKNCSCTLIVPRELVRIYRNIELYQRRIPMHDEWGGFQRESYKEWIRGLAKELKEQGGTWDHGWIETRVDRTKTVKKIPWYRILRRKLYTSLCNAGREPDWKRFNRRLPEIIPGVKRSNFNKYVYIIVDTSASTAFHWPSFAGHIDELLRSARTYATMIQCDVRVTRVDRKLRQLSKKIEFVGGGGTDMQPAFDRLAEIRSGKKKTVVMFTDGYLAGPITRRYESEIDLITVLTPQGMARDVKFGTLIRMEGDSYGDIPDEKRV